MSIIQAFLSRALNIAPQQVSALVHSKILLGPFAASLGEQSEAFLQAQPALADEVWKFSVSLEVPHQLLLDCYVLQQAVNQAYVTHAYVS